MKTVKQTQKEKKAKRRADMKLMRSFMAGTNKHFVLALIGVFIAAVTAYIIPLITGFTVDYVLIEHAEAGYQGGITLPHWLLNFVEGIGGRAFLEKHLYIMGLLLVFVTAINAFATYLRRSQIAYGAEKMTYNIRNRLYSHLIRMPYDYHKHISTGDIIQRCTSDVDTIRRFVQNQMLEIIRSVSMVIVASAIMFSMNCKLALYSIVLMPLLAFVSFIYFKNVKKQFELSDDAEGRLSAVIQENASGIRVVRAFGQQKSELDNFTAKNTDFRQKTTKLIYMLALYWGGTDILSFFQIALSICMSIVFILNKQLSVGEMLVFSTYTTMLVWPVRMLGRILADMGKASVSLGRIGDILKVPVETEPGAALKPEIKGNIEFKDVSFCYEDGIDVLKNISFTAEAGQTIAILGSTGSGKSSLVQLLQRLYTCRSGEILIDGVNVNDIEQHHLRKNIGIVLQEPFLYSKSIMDNIRIVNPEAPKEEVYKAAESAAIHDVIMGFENGYDTVVGERGVTLSGGQKQRVAIARMLMQKAPIIILDDSMSAVDTETDAAIRDALSSMENRCTTFIISHRITTLCRADKILVLDEGRIVQSGTHEELLRQEGLYKRIADIQSMLETEFQSESEVI